jgi:predicted AAA+ superfamily ATPase
MALLWLSDTDLVHQIHRITAPRNPLTAYSDRQAFKLFLLDVGLLGAMAKIDSKTLLNGNALFTEFKGAMTEQYVAQTLSAMESITAGYWNSDSGTAEMDFVIQHEGQIVPIEVKAETNLKAKSLKVYRDRFAPPIAIRTSLAPYHAYTDGLIDLPLYALSLLPQLLKLAP